MLGNQSTTSYTPNPSETRVLGPRPKLQGLHVSGPALAPIGQMKRHGEGHTKEVYYMAQDTPLGEAK
jgi:hypothetical protein